MTSRVLAHGPSTSGLDDSHGRYSTPEEPDTERKTEPRRATPNWGVWLVSSARQALGYRGPDGKGIRIGTWLGVITFTTMVTLLLSNEVRILTVLSPALLAAVLSVPLLRLYEALRREGRSRFWWWFELIGVLAGFGFAAASAWGFLFRKGIPIDTGDHPIMIARAEAFYHGLAQGRWLHWTHASQAGDSLGDLYPMFANLLTASVHAMAPRGASFTMSYTFTIVFAWWLRGVAGYFLARRAAGPAVAIVLSLAGLLDVGREVTDGVWNATIYWGMIHNNIALSFGAIALALQLDTMRKPTSARFVASTLMYALTAFAHPLGVVFGGLVAISSVLSVWSAPERREGAVSATAAPILGLMLACPYTMPLAYAHKTIAYSNAAPGHEYQALGEGLLRGNLPDTEFGAYVGLALVAISAALTRKEPERRLPAFVATLLWLLTLTPLVVQLGLLDYAPSFLDGQQKRLLTVLKLASVPSLAWFLSRAYAHVRQPCSLQVRAVLARALLFALLALGPARALGRGLVSLNDKLLAQVPKRDGEQRPHAGRDHELVFGKLAELRRNDRASTPWRVAILWHNRWRHAAWAEGFRTGVPVVDANNVSANFLTFRPREMSAVGFRDWNIRYAITDHPQRPFEGLSKVLQADGLTLWSFDDYDPRYVVGPAEVKVDELRFDGDEIRFKVTGAGPNGADVVLRTAWFPRWRAQQGGQSIPVAQVPPRPDAKPKQDQIGLHVHDGEVVLRCNGPMPRAGVGAAVGLLGLLGTVFGMVFGMVLGAHAPSRRRLQTQLSTHATALYAWCRDQLRAPTSRWRPSVSELTVLLVAAAAVVVWSRGSRQLTLPAIEGLGFVDVQVVEDDGTRERCTAAWWAGEYRCADARVSSWEGSSPVDDDSGEFHKLWPGTSLKMPTRGKAIELRFARVRSRRSVHVRASTHGEFEFRLRVGRDESPPRNVNGEVEFDTQLPEQSASAGPMTLSFKALGDDSRIVFDATAQ